MKLQCIELMVCLGLPSAVLAQDANLGQEIFRAKCIRCHAMACNRNGPKLEGVIGRRAGSLPEFDGYTTELKAAGFLWSEGKLDEFLADPNGTVPGTLMAYAGKIESSNDRRNLIAFLLSGDTTLDLCF